MSGIPARRYILPLFEVARDRGALDQISQDLRNLAEALSGSPELMTFLTGPTIKRTAKQAALETIFQGASPYTLNFLKLVVTKNRCEVLPFAWPIFRGLLDEHRGVKPGLLETAVPIDEATFAKLSESVAKRFGGKIELGRKVEPSILGGVRVRVGNTVIDASLKRRLEKLRMALAGE